MLDEVERSAEFTGLTIAQAEKRFARAAKAGRLEQAVLDLVRIANARRGKQGRAISAARLAGWRKMARGARTPAERIVLLAPLARGKKWALDADAAAALAKYRQPNKPSLAWCVAEILKGTSGSFESLYHRCRRALKRLPQPVFHVGRNSGAALKALQPFKRREFLSLNPNDVWIGDGHSAKLRVAHPITGNPFVPEVTVIMDVSDRSIVGWSVSLSENCIAVSDALRHAIGRHGVPLVYYSDNGGGQKNKLLDAPETGITKGLGIQHETGIPGNPQGRGAIERLWQTVLLPLARRFATYRGKDADRETLRKNSIEIDRQLRAAAKTQGDGVVSMPEKLPTFRQFLDALEAEIESYNTAHAHRSLPKLDGMAHATPAAYRAHRIAETGVEIQVPQPAELASLFMPTVLREVKRGEIRLFNGIYFHRDLMLIDGRTAPIGYDIHDASHVWVKHPDSGALIAVAELAGNRAGYFPKPFIEQLRDQRAARRATRLEIQLDEVRAEHGGGTVEARPLDAETAAYMEQLEADQAAPPQLDVIGLPTADCHRHWQRVDARRAQGEQLSERDERFWHSWQEDSFFIRQKELDEDFERLLAARRAHGPS